MDGEQGGGVGVGGQRGVGGGVVVLREPKRIIFPEPCCCMSMSRRPLCATWTSQSGGSTFDVKCQFVPAWLGGAGGAVGDGLGGGSLKTPLLRHGPSASGSVSTLPLLVDTPTFALIAVDFFFIFIFLSAACCDRLDVRSFWES